MIGVMKIGQRSLLSVIISAWERSAEIILYNFRQK